MNTKRLLQRSHNVVLESSVTCQDICSARTVCFDNFFQAQIHSKNPPEGTELNELDKKNGPELPRMSERFVPNFAPGSFALQQSIRLVYTLRSLSRGQNRATRATRDNQDIYTEIAHTHSATETKHNSQPETTKGSWPLLLPRRRHRPRRSHYCCCCYCCCCCCYCCCCCCCYAAAA